MSNLSYQRSRRREYEVMHQYEKENWFVIRAAGSKGIADIVVIKPIIVCYKPSHFEVKFIQIKTSRKIKKARIETKVEKLPFGFVNVDYYYFPSRKKK